MLGCGRAALLFLSVLGFGAGLVQARAQEQLDRGRTPAQLYASDCVECHRNPKAIGRTMGASSLAGFLREHYTASRESAAALAGYLSAMAPDPAARKPASTAARPAAGKPPATGGPGKGAQGQAAPADKPSQAGAKPADAANEAKPAAGETPPPAPIPAEAPAAKPAAGDAKPPP